MIFTKPISEELKHFCIETDKMNNVVYNNRGQGNPLRRMKQNFGGKAVELYINALLKAGDEKHILTIYPQGVFHSDLTFKDKGISVKSQDQDSYDSWGKGRFIFASQDPIKSHFVCGVLIGYTLGPVNKGLGNYQDFGYWVDSIKDIKFEISFFSNKEKVIHLDIWEAANPKFRNAKKVLVASKIPLEFRIDLNENFPKCVDFSVCQTLIQNEHEIDPKVT